VQVPGRIELVFFRTAAGAEPVRDWLVGLDSDKCRAIGQDLMRVQYRWPVGMPLVRPLGKGLFEVRTDLPDTAAARVLFCFCEGKLVALHGFLKKSQTIAVGDLKLARDRKRELENG
jgi:phage-related protein